MTQKKKRKVNTSHNTFVSAATLGDGDGNQDQSDPDLSAGSRDLRTYYTWWNTQRTNPLYTYGSAGHQFTLECPLTVLSICNLRPSEWELFTVPIRYPRSTFRTCAQTPRIHIHVPFSSPFVAFLSLFLLLFHSPLFSLFLYLYLAFSRFPRMPVYELGYSVFYRILTSSVFASNHTRV